jgi:hypothetical protein
MEWKFAIVMVVKLLALPLYKNNQKMNQFVFFKKKLQL